MLAAQLPCLCFVGSLTEKFPVILHATIASLSVKPTYRKQPLKPITAFLLLVCASNVALPTQQVSLPSYV